MAKKSSSMCGSPTSKKASGKLSPFPGMVKPIKSKKTLAATPSMSRTRGGY